MAKRVLITGASSGIGKASAKYLYNCGYDLVLSGRSEEKLSELKNSLSYKDNDLKIIAADLSNNDGVKVIFDFCAENKLIFDGMLHSAGIDGNKLIKLCDGEYLKNLMQVHYFAFMELCRNFYKKSFSNDGASIIAISSVANIVCVKASAAYACAKSAVDTAVKVMSKEFMKRRIRVNAIKPALVDTPLLDKTREVINIFDYQPLGYIEPEYIAFIVEFLLSEKSKYITGSFIPVSAGMGL